MFSFVYLNLNEKGTKTGRVKIYNKWVQIYISLHIQNVKFCCIINFGIEARNARKKKESEEEEEK